MPCGALRPGRFGPCFYWELGAMETRRGPRPGRQVSGSEGSELRLESVISQASKQRCLRNDYSHPIIALYV